MTWSASSSPNVSTYCTTGSGLTCTGNSGATWSNSSSYTYVDVTICGGGGQGGGGLCRCGRHRYERWRRWRRWRLRRRYFTRASDLTSTVTVTLGSGGHTSSGNANGQAGGNSTFGSYLTGYGGGGGGAGQSGTYSTGGTGGDLLKVGATASFSAVGFGGAPRCQLRRRFSTDCAGGRWWWRRRNS